MVQVKAHWRALAMCFICVVSASFVDLTPFVPIMYEKKCFISIIYERKVNMNIYLSKVKENCCIYECLVKVHFY